MRSAIWLALPLLGSSLQAQNTSSAQAPNYTVGSIVNAASNFPGPLAPNTIVSLYGTQLAWATRALTAEDVRAGVLPYLLPGAGVAVTIGHIYGRLYYVSPTQINLLIPAQLLPGQEYPLQVTRDSLAGPEIKIKLDAAAPGLFVQPAGYIAATHANNSPVTREEPSRPGEVVVLYATGLGQTVPPLDDGEIPVRAMRIDGRGEFQVLVDGKAVADDRILYAGVAPGFAGLYQVNLMLPEDVGDDPQIEFSLRGTVSPSGPWLPLRR